MNFKKYLNSFFNTFIERFIRFLSKWTILTLGGLLILGLLFTFVPLKNLSDTLIETNALENAKLYSQAITEFRTIYTSEVVIKMEQQGVEVTHDYHNKENSIPLPATLSMMLGKRIGEKGNGGATKLYSPYPFPWREKEGGLTDDFSKNAWNHLKDNPSRPYFEFENNNDEKILHYATADLLRPSCVNCHNTHPDTPKNDWKIGDVRGILQVSLPLNKMTNSGETGVISTMYYTVSMTLIILFLLGVIIKKLGRANFEIEEYSNQRELITQEMLSVIDEEKRRLAANLHDNIGQIISAAKLNLIRLNIENSNLSIKKKQLNKILEVLLDDAYEEVKNLSYSVMPEKILQIGLKSAIIELITKMEALTDINYHMDVKFDEEILSSELKSSVYMMIQEMLNNIFKHAQATKVTIQLIQNPESLILMVEDNGKGFDFDPKLVVKSNSLGIKNLYSRTKWMNGNIEINSRINVGTIITIEYPLDNIQS